jgi:type I restriction enzyme S subunit
MARETSSTIFKDLVNSPVGIIAEYIINTLAKKSRYAPLKDFISEIQTGKTPPMNNPEYYSSNDMEWIKPSDIGFGKYITASDWISEIAVKANKATIYKPNTILIICIGGGIGRLGIVNKYCSSNQQITGVLFKDNVIPEYAYYFFLSRYKIFEKNSSKSTLPIINQKGLGNLDFLCPKIDFQKEIVKYLDYCKDCLNSNNYPINDKFNLDNEIISFSIRAFKAYYTQKELLFEFKKQLNEIDNLNQAILQEAVQGKLVNQDPKDEPAIELLKRIKVEKAKSDKKEKSLPPIKTEEIPFEIPENWVWCSLGVIADTITKGSSPKWQGVQYVDSPNKGILFVTSKNVDSYKIDLSNATYVERKFNDIEPRSILKKGDLLTNIVGSSTNDSGTSIGKTAIFELDEIANINQAVCLIRIEHQFINKQFLLHIMNATFIIKMMLGKQFAPGGRANLSMGNISQLLIPIPSLNEQERIVVEIEKQLAKTKQLKEHIIANQQATEQLLKALLHQAFEVETN